LDPHRESPGLGWPPTVMIGLLIAHMIIEDERAIAMIET
jgi:hypothetical protein